MRTLLRRLPAVTLAGFLIAGLAARPTSGDGIVVPPADHDGVLAEQSQEAILVLHEDGRTQDLVLAIKVTARGSSPKSPGRTVARFSWIVPLPSPPEVAPEDARLFDELHRHVSTWPEPLWSTRLRRHMYGSGDNDPAVEVIRRESVGVYDVALVRENQPGALNRWLAREGYRTLEGADDVIGHYRDRGFVFACVKVRDAALKPGKAVHLHPLRFTFDTGRSGQLFFPMRMTGLQQGAFHVNLFAFYPGWLEERAAHGGYERCGFRVRYRDWDLPGLRDPRTFSRTGAPSRTTACKPGLGSSSWPKNTPNASGTGWISCMLEKAAGRKACTRPSAGPTRSSIRPGPPGCAGDARPGNVQHVRWAWFTLTAMGCGQSAPKRAARRRAKPALREEAEDSRPGGPFPVRVTHGMVCPTGGGRCERSCFLLC
jgi:uncharacterized protein DUF2330